MKNWGLILKAQKKTQGAFGADPSDVYDWLNKDEGDFGYKISLKKKLLKLKRMVQMKIMKKMRRKRRKKKRVQVKFSEVKQNLDSVISFVDCNLQYNKYYLIRQDTVKEQYKRGTHTKISLFFKHSINNTKYVGYLKCF
jgi:hypothetical protein